MIQPAVTLPLIEELDALPLAYSEQRLIEKGASLSIDQCNWPAFPYQPICKALVGRSRVALFIRFEVEGEDLRALHTHNNTSVYQDSCVEFFMQSPGSKSYFNFEFNCIGTCLASECFSRANTAFLSDDEIERIKRLPSLGRYSFEPLEGLHRWSLLVAIPFAVMKLDPQRLPSHIKANFYKCGNETRHRHYLSWSPIDAPKPDFHRPDCFGVLTF